MLNDDVKGTVEFFEFLNCQPIVKMLGISETTLTFFLSLKDSYEIKKKADRP